MNINKTILAILCITILEAVAIASGVDGTTYALVVGVLAGLGGYELKAYKEQAEEEKKAVSTGSESTLFDLLYGKK
jgi:hypothetical protein